jgi:leucyl aminopeptidase
MIHQGEALQQRFPLIHAVGAASARAPRLVDCRWPRPGAPKVTLVGKGVCFDSGGLDIKPSAGMLLMKKDMGGAACALALARLLLEMAAPVQLRLLIPAVENSIGSRAYRPGDVWPSRKGLTVEIGNTDAEGRLVLADALAEADEERPALLVDLATLTGAARTTLGPDLPAAFGNADALLTEPRRSRRRDDPVWLMPLTILHEDQQPSPSGSGRPRPPRHLRALFCAAFAPPPGRHTSTSGWNPKDRPAARSAPKAACGAVSPDPPPLRLGRLA